MGLSGWASVFTRVLVKREAGGLGPRGDVTMEARG